MPPSRIPATGQMLSSPSLVGSPPAATSSIRYTRRAADVGWLSVRLRKSGELAGLCEYTQVMLLRSERGRTYFKIMDGYVAPGQEASLTDANAGLYLNTAGPGGAASVSVTYSGSPTEAESPFKGKLKQQWGQLSFGKLKARVTLNSKWGGEFTPIPEGEHVILAPDYSHSKHSTAGYVAVTPGMVGNDVWFPIGLHGSMENSGRYIHVGHLSEGCVTVYELGQWTGLYNGLIACRVPGSAGKRVGELIVKK